MNLPYHQIVVFRRCSDGLVHAYRQSWYWWWRELAAPPGLPTGGWQYRYTEREVPMAQLYAGHAQWVADQIQPRIERKAA